VSQTSRSPTLYKSGNTSSDMVPKKQTTGGSVIAEGPRDAL